MLTCNLALIVSMGFVINVVVKPPRVPATHCISKWEKSEGKILTSSSKNTYTYLLKGVLSYIVGA